MRRSKALRVAGLLSAVIYLVLAGRLSLWRYGAALESWAHLLGTDRATCTICLAGIGILMALYLWGLRSVRTGGAQRRTVWAFAFIFAGTLLWLLPITSDLFAYLTHAHMLTDLGANPLLQAPLDFQDSLLVSYPTVYAVRPSVYGPAWVLLSAVGTIGPHDVPVGLFYLKGLVAVAYLGGAWLIERMLLEFRPQVALEGLYLFAWNPFVLLMAVGDGHNDMIMMALALLGIWLVLKERWVLAFSVLALSVWIKYLSFALLPLIGIYVWRRLGQGQRGALLRPMTHACLAAVVVSFVVLAPLGWMEGLLGIVGRLMLPLNWSGGTVGMPAWFFRIGLLLFLLAYGVLLVRALRGSGAFQQLVNVGFLAFLLAFLLGAARSQPWHLLWPAALAGLSDYRWAVPVMVGLSGLMLVVQVGVEWALPSFSFLS